MSKQTVDYELALNEIRHALAEHGPSIEFRDICAAVEDRLIEQYPRDEVPIVEMIVGWRVQLGELAPDVGRLFI